MNAVSNQSTLYVLKESILHEGPRVLFRGWLPAWSRLQPTTILTFLALEQLRKVVDLNRGVNGEA
jgi:dicarboxylate transporter 10